MFLSTGCPSSLLWGCLALLSLSECLPVLAPEAGAQGLASGLLVSSSTADWPGLPWSLLRISSSIKELLHARASQRPFMLQSCPFLLQNPTLWGQSSCLLSVPLTVWGLLQGNCFKGSRSGRGSVLSWMPCLPPPTGDLSLLTDSLSSPCPSLPDLPKPCEAYGLQ